MREDAATTDLAIIVRVRDGIVYLHGSVPDLVDSDNAVEVAARVPGVTRCQLVWCAARSRDRVASDI